ncbi:WD40/YVTN/BNR-like repeat-containing protein [Candidatus Manganitrophus noduliformans]|uniref:Sortilin N-terminal domain-containing protein n=1 Tax=Candidatus Manganitrophus noduliformans TaxID=2606439 RepID=A0A7X6DNE2_9BACT|nr:hypothetical protein [Candidatus Manganitrophus noduliformans]NKE70098.1 hypothetical protein [Candidatus Manganitrophus noduliformans]
MVRHLDRPQQNDRVEALRISDWGLRIKRKNLFALQSAIRNPRSAIALLLLSFFLMAGCQKGVGTIYSIAIHPTRPEVIYLSSEKGLYKTVDGGTLWNRIEGGLGTFPVLSIAISPALPSILYVGTFSDGVYRSTDAGRSWLLINAGMRDYVSVVNAVVIDQKNPHILYAGTTMGSYKSVDNGVMWERISTGLNSVFVVCMAVDPQNPSLVYAGTSGGVYKSSNGGQRWTPSNNGIIEREREHAMALGVNAFAFDPATPGRLFTATAQGLYESRDGGERWIDRKIPDPFVLSVAVRPGTQPSLYAGTNRGLYASRDEKGGWEKLSEQEVRAIALDPNRPEVIYIGTGSGLFKTEDGGKGWTRFESLQ